MATKRLIFPVERNNLIIQGAYFLSASEEIDGTSASAQSAVIDGSMVRIAAKSTGVTVKAGTNPTATAGDIYVPAEGTLLLPVTIGDKVAVLGGKANICTVGQ